MVKYTINEKNVLGHELIGLECEIIRSSDVNKQGLKGIIWFEGKENIELKCRDKIKIIPKKEIKIELKLPSNKKIKVEGILLKANPEDRTKMWGRKYYVGMQ